MDRTTLSEWWTEDRAQTAQDFAIGISLFLLIVGSVFAFFPSLFAPYGQAIQGEDTGAQADRVATLIVDGEETHTITEDDRDDWLNEQSGEDIQSQANLKSTSQVNVTVTPLDPEEDDPIDVDGHLRAGHNYQDQDASSTSRIVRVDDDEDDECDPACRLTVRVW